MAANYDSLNRIFSPRSIAVIGASRNTGTVGHTLFRNLLSAEFAGEVYPVNPHWRSVGGVTCYPDVAALPAKPDLAVVMVPALEVAATLEQLGEAGSCGAIIISAGFKEIGGVGIKREEEVVTIAKKHGISLIGPNCFGVFNTDPQVRLNATFSETMPPAGNIAFVSQSGALGQGILLHARSEKIGFTKFVSVGNRAGINETDVLGALGDDDATRVVLLYLESLAEGRRFLETAAEVTKKKPVLIIKSGRTERTEQAVMSHTGSLARAHSDRLYDAIFDEAGVIRVGSIGELFRMAKVFASCETPKGTQLGILTNSGGPGILAADAAYRGGLVLPPTPEVTKARIAEIAPPNSSLDNPVDLTAGATAEQYREILGLMLAERELHNILIIATPTGETSGIESANAILAAKKRSPKPVVACLFGVDDLSAEVSLLESNGIPCFTFPEEGAAALSQLNRYSKIIGRTSEKPQPFAVESSKVSAILGSAKKEGLSSLPDHMARGVLAAYGFRFPQSALIGLEDDPVTAAEKIGYPLVVKIVSPDILHKTDVGGVVMNINNSFELKEGLRTMRRRVEKSAPNARLSGFSLESHVTGGTEVILGMKRDEDFGPLILFGIGGVFVEFLQDIGFRPAPLTYQSVERLVESVRASQILRGVRGKRPSDMKALREALLRFSQLAVENPSIRELDLNPLIVLDEGKGVVAVDCRAIL